MPITSSVWPKTTFDRFQVTSPYLRLSINVRMYLEANPLLSAARQCSHTTYTTDVMMDVIWALYQLAVRGAVETRWEWPGRTMA